MSKPTVIAVLPNRGMIKPLTAEAFYAKPTAGNLNVLGVQLHTSVLESTFNELWVAALNQRSAVSPRYFAMLHDDVCPEHFWLDKLVEELERHDADIVSAVMPIRDLHGMTTTGVTDPNDIWSTKLRRMSVREALSLPTTFSRDDINWPDCPECLVVGSGCWVCRFDAPWVEQITWRLESRNIKIGDTWCHQRQSEDWLFSIDAHKMGLKVLGTTAVKMHHGDPWFNNYTAWGEWAIDEVWREHHGAPKWFPTDVEGWLTVAEGLALRELAAGKRVLEIGSYCGRSTICLAQDSLSVVSVDPHDGSGTPRPRNTYTDFIENVQRYGVSGKVTVQWPLQSDSEYDLIFIDGAHDYDSVMRDIESTAGLLAPGGVLAFHDYRNATDGEVAEAVTDFISRGAEMIAQYGSIVVVRPTPLFNVTVKEQTLA